ELVKFLVVSRVVLRSVPPVPVATFRDQNFFKGQLALSFGRATLRLGIKISSMIQIVPRAVVFGSTDPHVEVSVNPRAWYQRCKLRKILVSGDGLRHSHCFYVWFTLQTIVETTQEFSSGFGIVLPRILPVEDDRHDCIPALRKNGLRRLLNVLDEMLGGVLWRHARIDKAN